MPLSDIMSSIFKGLFDPTALARELAQEGVSPQELLAQAQKTQQLQTMPTAGAQNQNAQATGSNAAEQQQQGGSISNIFKDLMAPTPPTAQAGQLGNAMDRGQNSIIDAVKQIGGDLMQPMPQVPPINSPRLSDVMQPATAATGLTGNAPGTQSAMALQPMPPQLQGLPAQLMSGGSSVPPPMTPQAAQAVSQFPPRPGVIPGNGPVLPGGAPIPTSSPQGQLGLAMQPNTQPMQPNRPGIERPASATTPNLGKDAQGVRQIALSTWYQGGVTNPFGLAALTSTGEHESGFSPANLNRSWSDPSGSGKAGTSGGMFSWRNERLSALQAYAKQKGEGGNGSPQTQADFFLHENPALIKQLNGAKSVDEAQQIMNNNIAFKGYNSQGGEAGRRLQTARTLVPQMEQFIKDPQAPPNIATPPVNNAADTIAPPSSAGPASGGPFSALDALTNSDNGSGAALDMNLPNPPPPVAPQPGRYDVNPQAMMAMLQMLGPMAGGAQIPSLMQLMNGK